MPAKHEFQCHSLCLANTTIIVFSVSRYFALIGIGVTIFRFTSTWKYVFMLQKITSKLSSKITINMNKFNVFYRQTDPAGPDLNNRLLQINQ